MICFVMEEGRWNYRRKLNQKDSVMAYPPPISGYVANGDANLHKELSPPSSSGARISPAVLFIIVILAVLFFISGVLHLLVRFLTKNHSSSQSDRNLEASSSDTLERQLQQLFHLHDSGLDQTFIDALPVFMYKEIVGGAKEPFDCAVCLCEFAEKDQLRLLPMCSHAFHINCIDTWLLSNSTCPLCRDTLFNPEFSPENPVFGFRDFRDDDEYPVSGEVRFSTGLKRVPPIQEVSIEKGVFPVRLGKFRKLDNMIEVRQEDVGETSSSRLDARRCYSMGSYQYIVGDANLRVAALSGGRISQNLNPISGRGGDGNLSPDRREEDGKKISIGSKNDSYSVSKIWLWSKKGKFASSSSSLNMDLPRAQRREGL